MENDNDNDMPHSYVEDKSSIAPLVILIFTPIIVQHFGFSATLAVIVTAVLFVLSLHIEGDLIY